MSGTTPLLLQYAFMVWTGTTFLYLTPTVVLELSSHNLFNMPNEKTFHHKLQSAMGYMLHVTYSHTIY